MRLMLLMNEDDVRKEILLPADKWSCPTPEEIRELYKMLNLTSKEIAACLGLETGSGSVRKWAQGQKKIPYAAWGVLCQMAGLGIIWEAK